MYCPKCGHEVGENINICPACGELLESNAANTPPYQEQGYPINQTPISDIPDYNVQSILLIVFSAILCCVFCLPIIALPFAIVALVNSNKVEAHVVAGNYDLARKASGDAKKWCWISFGILLGSIAVSIIFTIAFINSNYYREFMNEIMRQYEIYNIY